MRLNYFPSMLVSNTGGVFILTKDHMSTMQYNLYGDAELAFYNAEDEAKHCMEVAFREYLEDNFNFNKKINVNTLMIETAWKKMDVSTKTNLKNRAVGVWVDLKNKQGGLSTREKFSRLKTSIFTLDRCWRKVYNFMSKDKE